MVIPIQPHATPTLKATPSHNENPQQIELMDTQLEIKDVMTVKLIQEELARREYYQGEISGQYDDATIQAMRKFQEANKLPATGYLTPRTLSLLSRTLSPEQSTKVDGRTAAQASPVNNTWKPITAIPVNIKRPTYWMVIAGMLGRNLRTIPADRLQLPPTEFLREYPETSAQTIFQLIKEQELFMALKFALAVPDLKVNLSELQAAVTREQLIRIHGQMQEEMLVRADQLPAEVFVQILDQAGKLGWLLEDYLRRHKLPPYRIDGPTPLTATKKNAMYEDWTKDFAQFLQSAEKLSEEAYQRPLTALSYAGNSQTLVANAKETAESIKFFLQWVSHNKPDVWPEIEQCTNKAGVLNLYRRLQAEGQENISNLTENSNYEIVPAIVPGGDGKRISAFDLMRVKLSAVMRHAEQLLSQPSPAATKERK